MYKIARARGSLRLKEPCGGRLDCAGYKLRRATHTPQFDPHATVFSAAVAEIPQSPPEVRI
jgi:hypothetical protein